MRQVYARVVEIDRLISNFNGDMEGTVKKGKRLIAQLYGYTGDLADLGGDAWTQAPGPEDMKGRASGP